MKIKFNNTEGTRTQAHMAWRHSCASWGFIRITNTTIGARNCKFRAAEGRNADDTDFYDGYDFFVGGVVLNYDNMSVSFIRFGVVAEATSGAGIVI